MLSMPPAITSSASPARISAAASMIAFRPEPQTRFIVVAEVVAGSPAFSAAWRAGAWPTPACRTSPISTSSIGASPGRPERSTAARIATPPSTGAEVVDNAPPNRPIGVRAALTTKVWPLECVESGMIRVYNRGLEGPVSATRRVRWGILGTGAINRRFLAHAGAADNATFVAVGSRSIDRARAFAGEHGISAAHGSYEALLADPDVEVVY